MNQPVNRQPGALFEWFQAKDSEQVVRRVDFVLADHFILNQIFRT